SPQINNALNSAEENRTELEKVITHYQNSDDTLKLKAALYLIANMEDHSYVTYNLIDSSGEVVNFNVQEFPNYDSLLKVVEIIEKERGEMDYEKSEKIFDNKTIKAEFLIEQIESAFKAWREKPWANNLPYLDFCRYVLPYRGSNEPLEKWREYFLDKYKDLPDKMLEPTDAIEAANIINDDIKSWFGFDERYYFHPTDQGLSEMLENKLGRCEDMTNLTIYAMRANGLAVTSDYTPYWANTGNNHAWNAIVKPSGEVIPFMGAESNPGKYKLAYNYAKIYRKMYNQNLSNLIFQERKQEAIPRWLSGKSYIDVTADYIDVSDVTIKFEQEIPDSIDIAYICVFNSGKWKPIHWGWVKNGKAVFTDMVTDIAYLPALYINEEIVPYASPFILEKDKSIKYLTPDENSKINAELTSTTKRKKDKSTEGITKIFLKDGVEYELFYYKSGWESLGTAVAGDQPITFNNIPDNSLLWLVAKGPNRDERIFTYENGQQIWW
ncbi:transglutaminase-like domain-containing protein, partial [Candidatus Zixiibacteriota bacterium]